LTINPGDPNVFPWLSVIAAGYEKFKIHKLKVKYEHTCSSLTQGQYVYYFDYDSRDTRVTDIAYALQNYDRVGGAAYVDSTLQYKKQLESLKSYYIQKQTIPDEAWIIDETPAKLNIVVSDGASTPVFAGNIFFSYEIELIAPVLDVSTSTTSLQIAPYPGVDTETNNTRLALEKQVTEGGGPGKSIEAHGIRPVFIDYGGPSGLKWIQTGSPESNTVSIGGGGANWVAGLVTSGDDQNVIVQSTQPDPWSYFDSAGVPAMEIGTLLSKSFTTRNMLSLNLPKDKSSYFRAGGVCTINFNSTVNNAWFANPKIAVISRLVKDSLGTYRTTDIESMAFNIQFAQKTTTSAIMSWSIQGILNAQSYLDKYYNCLSFFPIFNQGDYSIVSGEMQNMVAYLTVSFLPSILTYSSAALTGARMLSRLYRNEVEAVRTQTLLPTMERRQKLLRDPPSLIGSVSATLSGMSVSGEETADASKQPPPNDRSNVLRTPEGYRDHTSKYVWNNF
jgi:hypothetical protein